MIKNIQKEKTRLGEIYKFTIEGAPIAFCNALRRIMISSVPTYAIEYVHFIENTSSMHDEILAHRLALIPITGKPVIDDEIVKLYVEKEGPCTVYSKDLISDTDSIPAFDNIPIVKLKEGQKLSIECDALVGIGRTHGKWQPCNVSYKLLDNGDVEFTVESHGQIDSEDILISAIDILKNKAEKFLYELESYNINTPEEL